MKERLYRPLTFVVMAVIISVLTFLLISTIVEIEDFRSTLILSIVIPIAVSLPMSIMFLRYLKQIREQKIALEKLDSTNKKIFSLLSHDIRNPLATLKGMVYLLVNDTLEMEEGKRHLNQLSTKIDSVLDFLDDLLLWSKKQTEDKPIEPALFKCKEVLKPSYELLDDLRKAKHIQLEIGDLDNNIYTDKNIYAFVFRNVYHNAIKFTPEHGKIEINTEVKGDNIHTLIKDSGVGIAPEDIQKIYDEGNWFTTEGTANEEGTGFGLSSCINYLKEHDGELLIESEQGKGTTMSIVLPQNSH